MATPAPDSGPTVLVGVDGSQNALRAARFGRVLADSVRAGLEGVRVRSTEPQPGGGAVETIELGGGHPPLAVSKVEAPSPAAGLSLAAESRAPLALVVGATHERGVGRLLHGSVPGRLLAGLACPLVIVPAGYVTPGRIRVIEIGFNATPESSAALDFAADLGRRAEATLRVLAVETAPPPESARPEIATEHLQERLHDAVSGLPAELRAQPIHARGDAAGELLTRAEEGVDLVVLGSRRYGPVRSVLLGSVATAVIERAPCPVLVTPRGDGT